ncbi:MAG: hypothetical protein ACTHW3_10095 [Leucobacter sp.]
MTPQHGLSHISEPLGDLDAIQRMKYWEHLLAEHEREPLRLAVLLLGRAAAALPSTVTARPTSKLGLSSLNTEVAQSNTHRAQFTRREVRDTISRMIDRDVLPPWWQTHSRPKLRREV